MRELISADGCLDRRLTSQTSTERTTGGYYGEDPGDQEVEARHHLFEDARATGKPDPPRVATAGRREPKSACILILLIESSGCRADRPARRVMGLDAGVPSYRLSGGGSQHRKRERQQGRYGLCDSSRRDAAAGSAAPYPHPESELSDQRSRQRFASCSHFGTIGSIVSFPRAKE
jgi:hypothetical protein